MLNKQHLLDDYNCLLDSIESSIRLRNYPRALQLIDLASRIQYQYGFLLCFYDKKLEGYIKQVAYGCFEKIHVVGHQDKVLFYDYFGYDNRGLTQQYLRALMHLGKEIVYILENPNGYYESSSILDELNSYRKSNIYQLKGGSNLEKINEVLEIVKKESPDSVFLHLAPWDVVACTAFNVIEGMTRYQINITDHAFWLGVDITDVCIEFRAFGFNLSRQKRNIEEGKLRILPYYPIINHLPFEGLPPETTGKKVIFSGGSIYKVLGENLLFLDLIKNLLAIDENLIFIFAGSGNKGAIEKFVSTNNLEKRFLLIGDRKDISSLLENVDYYITTFPFTGALMSQIAAAAGKPTFFFSKEEYQCNDLSDLFFKYTDFKYYANKEDLLRMFITVYKDDVLLKSYGEALKESMITPAEFAYGLQEIMVNKTPYKHLHRTYDVSRHLELMCGYMLESENSYNPTYEDTILSYLKTILERKKILPTYFHREQKANWESNKIQFLKNQVRLILPNNNR